MGRGFDMTQVTEAIDVVPSPPPLPSSIAQALENRYYTASQFQLMWWKFKKHKLALIGSAILGLFVFVAAFAEFLSPYAPGVRTPNYLYGRPQVLHFVDAEGKFHLRPFTYALTAAMDPETFLLEVKEDTSEPWPIYFLVKGNPYKMWGLIESNVHLFGVKEGHLHLLGTDQLGRDILSRLFHATRTSLTIGVVGLFIS